MLHFKCIHIHQIHGHKHKMLAQFGPRIKVLVSRVPGLLGPHLQRTYCRVDCKMYNLPNVGLFSESAAHKQVVGEAKKHAKTRESCQNIISLSVESRDSCIRVRLSPKKVNTNRHHSARCSKPQKEPVVGTKLRIPLCCVVA